MTDARHVLLAGGSADDAQRIVQVLREANHDVEVLRVAGLDEAKRLTLPPLLAVLVSLDDPDQSSAWPWSNWLTAARLDVPLLAVARLEDEPFVTLWLAQGGDDWLFRPRFQGLPAVLARHQRQRHHARVNAIIEAQWREGTAALMQLARSQRFFLGEELHACLAEVNETAVRGIRAQRCGIWLFDEALERIELVDLYDAGTLAHSRGQKLVVADSRPYFDALHSQRMLVVPDVYRDERSAPLVESYFRPNNIAATIDVGIQLRGRLRGCLCLEQVGAPHAWHPGEESFAGALADVVALALESAERAKLERALMESERRFRDLFSYSKDLIFLHRVEGDGVVLEDLNPAAVTASGLSREQLVERPTGLVLKGEEAARVRERFRHIIATRAPLVFEEPYTLPLGRYWFNTSMVPLTGPGGEVHHIATYARDVTKVRNAEAMQRTLEAQLADAQKSEALARLASHIAHDVNNLLTVVNTHAQRLQDTQTRPAEVAQAILKATARGRELTQQVLTFGRRRPPEKTPVEVGALLDESLTLLVPTAGSVKVVRTPQGRVPRVMADAGQLAQVITNLTGNALAAMEESGGTLTLSLDERQVDYAFAAQHPPLKAGRCVRLTVADTGPGMDAATVRRIFEPFFSTRGDEGTGLGLAVVQSIVEAHDGAVVVDTAPGRGASFQVYLPAHEEAAQRGTGQHLMLVDDNAGMARVSARLLETLGYRTTVFDDPREALEAFRKAPALYDAVLTDLSMPQMSGEDFALALHEVRAELPIIVSSGLGAELDDATRQKLHISAVLVKPWRLEEAMIALQRSLK